MTKFITLSLILFIITCASKPAPDEFPPLVPFLISYDGADNASGMAHLLDAPAGKHGFVRVENGRFVNDAGQVRLHATNLTGAGNFPTHKQADRLAARLARFGINCVRLHHMDTYWKWTGIIADDPTTQRNFDAAQVDRLDYMIAAFKKLGIYVDINLHVGRWWDERDSFTGKDMRPSFDKGLDNFEPRMIGLQKEYARKLLTHINPYTGLSYTKDPCVSMVELNNENALLDQYHRGNIDRLPDPYATEFRSQWNTWLRKKYVSTEMLMQAWKSVSSPLRDEQITEGGFSQPIIIDGKKWIFSCGAAEAECVTANGVLAVTVSRLSDGYFPKLFRSVSVKKDQPYTLSFRIRRTKGSGDELLGLAVADANGGWRSMGLHQTFKVGAAWEKFSFSFFSGDNADNAQFQLTRFRIGTYEIDDVSFQSGAKSDFDPYMRLEASTIPTVKTAGFVPMQAKRDFYQFLVDTERTYWVGLSDYLKKELKVRSVISGTQVGYSPPHVQAELDYIDIHAYWQHPNGINLLQDRYNWQISNESMVNSMTTIHGLAGQRILNKPYTVSEYNHPFPNQYGAEGHPLLCAYGRFQGWDGVFQYTYNHDPNFEPNINPRYFDMIARTDVLAHFPACAAIFLRGDVQEARSMVIGAMDYTTYFDRLLATKAVYASVRSAGFDWQQTLLHKTAVDLSGKHSTDPASVVKINANQKIFVSDTGELTWNVEQPEAGYWTVNTPNTKLFTGFPKDRTISLGEVTLVIGKTRLGWATISLVSRNATGFGETGHPANLLLAATGVSENKGMTIEHVSDKVITIRDKWGDGPVCVEVIPASVTLPSNPNKTKCFALDPEGNRKMEVPVAKAEGGGSKIVLKAVYETVWYEIDIK